MLDHLGVQVADVEASAAFYLAAFGPIGMREIMRHEVPGGAVVGFGGPDGIPTFWLSPGTGAESREIWLLRRLPPRSGRPQRGGRPPRLLTSRARLAHR